MPSALRDSTGRYVRGDDRVRFMSKVKQTPSCWNWRGSIDQDGYAAFWLDGGQRRAARIAWLWFCGPLVDGLEIDHLCRNRRCVRPDHLAQVTGRINTLRSAAVSADNARKTHCKRGHPFSVENTHITAEGHRTCRACKREHTRRRLGITPDRYRTERPHPRCAVCGAACARFDSTYCSNSCRGKAGARARWG